MNTRRATTLLVALLAAALSACMPPVIDQPGTAFDPAAASETTVRVAELPTPVMAANATLSGFRFVVDPGHGGAERGAPSAVRGNATEADLNLAVSLFLGGLLQASGAEVIYTRNADHPVLPGADLASDLRARADLANRHLADLFLSIHHNGSMDSGFNRVELYPKLRSSGASYAAGIAINRELGRLYPDFDSRSLAGNFAVLRRLHGEGVLVECSYLSDRRLAPRLESITLARKEAEAIYRGIASWAADAGPSALLVVETGLARLRARRPGSWLSARAASWRGADRVETTWQGRASVLEWSFPADDPDSVTIELVSADGTPFKTAWTSTRHRAIPPAPPIAFVLEGFSNIPESVVAACASAASSDSPPPVVTWNASDPSRTLLAVEDLAPGRLVVVSPSSRAEVVHYFRSENGRRWAVEVARRLGIARVTAGSHYLLNHTSMPALWVRWSPSSSQEPRP